MRLSIGFSANSHCPLLVKAKRPAVDARLGDLYMGFLYPTEEFKTWVDARTNVWHPKPMETMRESSLHVRYMTWMLRSSLFHSSLPALRYGYQTQTGVKYVLVLSDTSANDQNINGVGLRFMTYDMTISRMLGCPPKLCKPAFV